MAQTRLENRPRLDVTRHYPVAPEKVWHAWTDPQALSHWFGPGDTESVADAELDVRPGGFVHERFFDEQARINHERGWTATFAKLDAYLRG